MLILPILLFASIGISGWAYGPNLIWNPNFTENASFWVYEGEWLNESGNGVLNITYYTYQDDSVIPYSCYPNKYYLYGFDFMPINDSAMFQAITFGGNDYVFNSSCMGQYGSGESCSIFPPHYEQSATSITPLGNGWFRLLTLQKPDTHETGAVPCEFYVEAGYPTQDTWIVLDNAFMREASYQCVGYECPNLVKDILNYFPVILGLLVLSAMIVLGLTGNMTIVGIIGLAIMALIAIMFISVIAGIV